MLDLFVAGDLARREMAASLEAKPPTTPKRDRPRRDGVRSTSAAALRSLAERLEPSPSA
jgi:hypothetical protein